MEWKKQLTRTPYLVLFIVLISIGVGTASAVITITLSGYVLITEDLTVEGYIKTFDNIIVGDSDPNSVDYNRIGVESPANSQIDSNEDLFVSDTLEVGNDIFLGNTELTRGIGFYEDGASNGEFIRWNNGNDEFEISDDLKVDGKLGVGISQADSALHVVGGGSDFTPNKQGIQLTGSDAAGNVGIELTGNGKTPYIDFQNDITGTDFDARIVLRGNDTLSVEGADLKVEGDYTYSTNQTRKLILKGNSFLPLDGYETKRTYIDLRDWRNILEIGGYAAAISPVYGIPHGAILKEFSCRVWENDSDVSISVTCTLYKQYGSNANTMATLTNSTQTSLSQVFSTTDISSLHQVFDQSSIFSYVALVSFDPIQVADCAPDDCRLIQVEIIYEVSKTD